MIAAQVRSGKIPESVVDEAVRRILRVKFALGLFDHPYTRRGPAYDATPERRAAARKVADETFVLLKNDPVEGVGALLPLTAKAKKVALIGPMADNQQRNAGRMGRCRRSEICDYAQGGACRAVGRPAALCAGLRSALRRRCQRAAGDRRFSGQAVAEEHLPIPDDAKTIAEAVETAKKADVAILALGEHTNWMEGEAASRVHLGFTGAQEQLLEAVVGHRQAGDPGGAGRPSAGVEVGRRACARNP